jgi:hypothetical protein
MRTGSLQNMIADGSSTALQPEVGMGATVISWTDRHAGTIVAVERNGRQIIWQQDRATRVDGNGMSDAQEYSYERWDDAPREKFTLRQDGSYRRAKGTSRLVLGVRQKYHDYSF